MYVFKQAGVYPGKHRNTMNLFNVHKKHAHVENIVAYTCFKDFSFHTFNHVSCTLGQEGVASPTADIAVTAMIQQHCSYSGKHKQDYSLSHRKQDF